jgi:pullulanase/glycogen debranching enzyme
MVALERADVRHWALRSGHWIEGGMVHFFLWKALNESSPESAVKVVGPFNDWGRSLDHEPWTLLPVCVLGVEGWELAVPLEEVLKDGQEEVTFKFLRLDGRWLEPPHDADNIARDGYGNRNLVVSRQRTGQHLFRFQAIDAAPDAAPLYMIFETPELLELCDILASDPLDVLEPPGPFGATVVGQVTTFRIFAPRAQMVEISWRRPNSGIYNLLNLKPEGQGAWAGQVAANLSGALYTVSLRNGLNTSENRFNDRPFVDPWARLQTDDTPAEGVVLGPEYLQPLADHFQPPHVEDLVILEGHVRDLLGLAGTEVGQGDYRALATWIRSHGNYLRSLGVNALELLPCAEFEHQFKEEYHWGYMPLTPFGVANQYTTAPGPAALEEFRDLVRACHEAGLAVIMDVVLNHFGSPNGLMAVDPGYYFRVDSKGQFSNWSGCGNDVRAESPMFKRLVLESLAHWTEVLGVDGVRLDLAELLGAPLLREIESDFRLRHPQKILIAEPWSFRGYIARDLDDSTWTSWDDAFREFLPSYVRGQVCSGDLLHHMAACDSRPSARLHYAQSHDDMAWIDRITERPEQNALEPAANDVLRTRMMHVILLCAAGVPMMAAGQDFLQTKQGVSNTWRRADLNRLDPARWERFRTEHDFVARLVHFRLSPTGAVLRPRTRVSDGWMKVAQQSDGEAFVASLNADGAMGSAKVLVAVNPHAREVVLDLPLTGNWKPIVLSPTPSCPHAPGPVPRLEEGRVYLPPLACAVWST